ncbi:fimbrial protein [Variovorax sp. UMC13]|nr:fimbrial protein [Variovorax sp. UMC13]
MGLALATLALLCGAPGAWATCVRYPRTLAKSVTMDMGRVFIPNDLAVGGSIASREFAIPTRGISEFVFDCTRGGGTLIGVMLQGSPVESGSAIYSTAVTGVGIRLSRVITADLIVTYPHRLARPATNIYFPEGTKFKVELIKTAAVTGNGPLAAGTYTQYYGDGDSVSMLTTTLSGNGITIITPSCTVDAGSRNIPVNFGKVATSSFSGRSSTAGDRNFNIQLNCSAGQNAQNTVQIKMDATADPANVDGVLRLTQAAAGTNTAGGIGIQVVNANTQAAVKFGDTVDVGPSKDGSYVLPYTARYYQTGDRVAPGQANGTATFTLDYR